MQFNKSANRCRCRERENSLFNEEIVYSTTQVFASGNEKNKKCRIAKHQKKSFGGAIVDNFKYILLGVAVIIAIIALTFGESKYVITKHAEAAINFNKLNYEIIPEAEEGGTSVSDYAYTLAQAVEKAPEGASTIKVLVGITETTEVTVPENKSILLDLNGKTTTFNEVSIINNGTLDIYSSEENGILYSSSSSSIHNKGILTTNRTSNQNEISIINTSTEDFVELIRNDSTATLNDKTTLKLQNAANDSSSTQNRYVVINRGTTTIDGATLINKAGETVYELGISNASAPLGGKIIVKSGSIETAGYAIMNIGGTGNSTSDPAIKITGGTIISTGSSAIYNEREDSMLYIAKEDGATPPTIYSNTTTSKTSVATIDSKGSFTMETGEIIGYSGMAVWLRGSNSTALVSGGTITKAQNPDNTVGTNKDGWIGGACFQYNGTKTATITGDTVIQNNLGNGSNVIYNAGTGTMEIGGNAKVRNLGASQVGGNFNSGKIIVKDNAEITSNGGNVLVNDRASSSISYTETAYPIIEIAGNAKLSTSGQIAISNNCAYGQIIVTGGTLTTDGTSSSYGTIYNNAENAVINVSGGEIKRANYPIYNAVGATNTTINITGGKVTATGETAIYNHGENATVTIGTVNAESNSQPDITGRIWSDKGGNVNVGDIIINSGTITGTTTQAVNGGGNILVTGGILNGSTAAINASGSTITVTGGKLTNVRHQTAAITNETGTTIISGNAYLEGGTKGVYTTTGNIIVTGGTIISTIGEGLYATTGTITLGNKEDTIVADTTSPVIIGKLHGVKKADNTSGTLNFYDGIVYGPTIEKTIAGNVTEVEPGYTIVNGTATYDGTEYKFATLAPTTNGNYLLHDGITAINTYTTLKEVLDEVTDSSKQYRVIALKDVTDEGTDTATVEAQKDVTLDLNGKIINYTGTGNRVIQNKGSLEIIDSTVDEGTSVGNGKITTQTIVGHRSIILNDLNADFTLTSGKLEATGASVANAIANIGKSVTLNGGEIYVSSANDSAIVSEQENGAKVKVTDTTITSKGFGIYSRTGTIEIEGGTIESVKSAITTESTSGNGTNNPEIKISGGNITSTGKYAINGTQANSMIYIQKVTGKTPPTISSTGAHAINTCGSFTMECGTINAYAGSGFMQSGSGVVSETECVTATVSGGTITKAKNPVTNAWVGSACFQIEGNGTAVITGDAVIQNESGNSSNVIYNAGTGTMEIGGNAKVRNLGASQVGGNFNSGKIIVKDNAEITSNGGNVLVNDRASSSISYTETAYPIIEIAGNAKLSTSGDRVINNACDYGHITVSGGTISAEGTNGSYGAIYNNKLNAIINISGGEITRPVIPIYNAKGGTNTKITITGGKITTTGEDAIYNHGEGATVTIGTVNAESNSQPDITGRIWSDKGGNVNVGDIIINSGTITGTTGVAIWSSGNITVNGGEISAAKNYGIISNDASAKITITNGHISSKSYAVTTTNAMGGIIEISGGTIESNTWAINNVHKDGKTVVSNDAKIIGRTRGIEAEQGMVEVKGGTITATDGWGIYASTGNVTITGGIINGNATTITNARGVYIQGGNLTIGEEGGTPSTSNPKITGAQYGVYAGETGTFNFYDGIITGQNGEGSSCSKEPDDMPLGYTRKITYDSATGTETSTLDNHYNVEFLSGNLLDGVTLSTSGGTFSGPTNGVYTGTLTTDTSYWRIDESIFTSGKTYLLRYKIKKTAGILKNIAGHSSAATQKSFTIDGEDSTIPYHLTGNAASNITDDTNEHIIEFKFIYKGNPVDGNIYIQPNRFYSDRITLNLYDVELYEVVQEGTKAYGEAYGTVTTPTRSGYTFKGWTNNIIDLDDKYYITETTKVTTAEDHRIYAEWTKTASSQQSLVQPASFNLMLNIDASNENVITNEQNVENTDIKELNTRELEEKKIKENEILEATEKSIQESKDCSLEELGIEENELVTDEEDIEYVPKDETKEEDVSDETLIIKGTIETSIKPKQTEIDTNK